MIDGNQVAPSGNSPHDRYLEEIKRLRVYASKLEEQLSDLQIMYDTTLEHGTELENELSDNNEAMGVLQNKMSKYLSPQLYRALVGGSADADIGVYNRVKLTVYFSDIVGFTNLTDTAEPEFLSDILNNYLTRMSEVALKYGGTVDKFIGDAVMVFFGAPEFKDDISHARFCVQMALDMREALYELRIDWKLKGISKELQVRAGLNTGFCTVGNFGSELRMDYTIIGGNVNLAARLQALAPADHIYISEATYSLVEDFVEAKFVGTKDLKGIHEPIRVWDLIGLKNSNVDDSPYCIVRNNTLHLHPQLIDLSNISASDCTNLKKDLVKVLVKLALLENDS